MESAAPTDVPLPLEPSAGDEGDDVLKIAPTKEFVDLSAKDLSDEEKAKLAAMKTECSSVFGELLAPDRDYWAADSGLLRFLVARGWNVKAASEMWKAAMKERTVQRFCEITTNGYRPPVVLRRYFPWGFIAIDKQGFGVLYERIGRIDLIGLLQAVGQGDFLKWVIWYHETQEQLMRRLTKSLGKDRSKFSVIIDMEGLNSRHLSMGTLNALKPRTVLEEKTWPETVKRLFLINTPRAFSAIWGIVSKFMNPGTIEKFQILGSSYQDALLNHIDAEALPKWLGGKFVDKNGDPHCYSLVPPGGLIPQAFIAGRPSTSGSTAADLSAPVSSDPSYFGVAGDGHGSGEEINIPSGKYSDVLIRVPAGATVSWRWASVDKDVAFRVTAVKASSEGVGPQVIDVRRSVAGVHLIPLVAAGAGHAAAASSGNGKPTQSSGPITSSTPGDIKATIPFAAAGAAELEVVPSAKVDKHYGSWTAPADGSGDAFLVRIRFDNSYSWVSSKTLVRRVDVLLVGHAFGTTPTITATAAEVAASTLPAILIEDDPLERYACGREEHLATFGTAANDVCWCPSVPKPPTAS